MLHTLNNKLLLLLFAFTFMGLLAYLLAPQVHSLSVAYCYEDTVACKIQNCETDNLVNNWPANKGNYIDCEKKYQNYSFKKSLIIPLVVLLLLAAPLTVFTYKRAFKRKPKQK